MAAMLIVLALAALGVGIVVWATRRKPGRAYENSLEQDTAWNDTVHPFEAPAREPSQTDPEKRP